MITKDWIIADVMAKYQNLWKSWKLTGFIARAAVPAGLKR